MAGLCKGGGVELEIAVAAGAGTAAVDEDDRASASAAGRMLVVVDVQVADLQDLALGRRCRRGAHSTRLTSLNKGVAVFGA